MKTILEFNLPEDQEEFNNAIKASDMSVIIWKMDQWLRGKIKHGSEEVSKDTYEAYKECRNILINLKQEFNINE